jgi:hypothetical protein
MPHHKRSVSVLRTDHAWSSMSSLQTTLLFLQALIRKGNLLAAAGHEKVDKEQVKALDAKMRAFNPMMDKSSELYKRLKRSKRKRDND